MAQDFKHSLIFAAIFAVFCFFSGFSVAQEIKVPAVPPTPVAQEKLAPLEPKGLVVIELFSSQACLFCPKADKYMDELSEKDNVIALACHVDYFDVKEGSLAKPFCTQRQSQYSRTLRSGPKYTPQMVLNGNIDAIGHKREKVAVALNKAASTEIAKIAIQPIDGGKYRLSMPAVTAGQYTVWVALIENPLKRTISQGKHRGKVATYKNIVSSLESPVIWGGEEKNLDLSANLGTTKESVIVFAQNQMNGDIVAAGRFKRQN